MIVKTKSLGLAALLLGALALAACDGGAPAARTAEKMRAPAMGDSVAMMAQPAAVSMESAAPGRQAALAVSHAYTLRLPAPDVERVLSAHLDVCRALKCEIMESRIQKHPDGRVSAWVTLRIPPEAFTEFAAALSGPPVELISHSETVEDKTIPLLDVEKRLEVKIALRDRLALMLKDRRGETLADLLAVERELAQVQGDIEAETAQRDYLRSQTNTIRVSLRYEGATGMAGGLDFSRLIDSLGDFGQTMMISAAALITFIALALPWAVPGFLILWGLCRLVRRLRKRCCAAKVKPVDEDGKD